MNRQIVAIHRVEYNLPIKIDGATYIHAPDEFQNHYVEQKKPDTKRYCMIATIENSRKNKSSTEVTKSHQWLPGLEKVEEKLYKL